MLKITHNNIELTFVSETLSITKERDVFHDSVTLFATDRPFLLIENESIIKSLGPANRFSKTEQTYNVQVQDDFIIYQGKLKITKYLNGYREANLVYYNNLLKDFETKTHTYFDDVVVNGIATPYVSETTTDFEDSFWTGFIQNIIPRTFPEVDFNFPTLKYPTRMGAELNADDKWYKYKGEINAKNIDRVYLNSKGSELINQNIIVPYYYLLAPLYKIFKDTLGYTIEGSFIEHTAIQKTLLHHKEDLLVEIKQPEGDESEWKTVFKHHLTIEPSRFLPEETVADYLNKIKNNWNVEIIINQTTKTISLNFAQEAYSKPPKNISNFIFTEELYPEPDSITNYVLKDATGEDLVNVSESSITNVETEIDVVKIETAFKETPLILTKEWEEKNGIGLMFYDYFKNDTYNILEHTDLTHAISGVNGIAANFWIDWIIMRLEGKPITTKMICTPHQKNILETERTVWFSNQSFHILKTTFKKLDKNYEVEVDFITSNR